MKVIEVIKYFEKNIDEIKINIKADPSNKFRINAYILLIEKLTPYKNHKLTKEFIYQLDISYHMKEKLLDILSNNDTATTNATTNDQLKKYQLLSDLIKIHGIGIERANSLVDNGLTNISQLTTKKYISTLPLETQVFLKYKPIDMIPHDDIKQIEKILNTTIINNIIKKLPDNADHITFKRLIIVGSYRRNTNFSRDVDVMVVISNSSKNKSNRALAVLYRVLSSMMQLHIYNSGESKISMIAAHPNGYYFKFDMFLTNEDDEIPMLLYSTGSKDNNIRMRQTAKSMGYLLNQHGLFDSLGNKIPLNGEKDYYKKLSMRPLEPNER